jgi:hypothetical protein
MSKDAGDDSSPTGKLTSVSPKRRRTSDLPYLGTPERSPPPRENGEGDGPDTPTKPNPTPIRMGIVRKSIVNITRSNLPTPTGSKAAPPALPGQAALKAKAPGLPPAVPKKAAPPLPEGPGAKRAVDLPQLRPLFWHTFPPPTDRACVWDDVDVSVTGVTDIVKQAESKLVSLFAHKKDGSWKTNISSENLPIKNNDPKPKQAASNSQQPAIIMNGKRIMKVLDDRKTQNLAIALRRFPDPESVMEAIISVDTSKLSNEQVSLLLQEFPCPDLCAEIERVENSHPEEEDHIFEWDRPEQYLLVMACIHNCKEILTVWSFAVNHHNKVDGDCGDELFVESANGGSNAKQQLSDFIAACDCVCNSTALRTLLATMREVGNRMNLNTSRGNARGVSIESILQFDDVKSGGVSLLSVVVEIWLSKNADHLKDLQSQLGRLRKLRIPSIQEIEIDTQKQLDLSKKASESLRKYYQELEEESSVVIADKLKALSDPVVKQVRANGEMLQKAKASWNKCLSYFCVKGDSPLTKNSNDFFDHWKKVLKIVEKYAYNQN